MLEDERQKFKEKVLRAKSTDRVMLLKKFVDENLSDLKTKKEKIIFLGKNFGVSCWVIDAAVGCHHGYARAFLRALSGEIVESGRERRSSSLNLLTKQKVLKRDNWQCVRCRAKKNLNFHHIVPYWFKKADNLDNLAILCEKCHRWAHREEGFGGTVYRETKADFWKWVLRTVSGIGEVSVRSLYRAGYRTRQDLEEPSVDELAKVPHVGLETAKKIKRQIVLATVR